MTREQLEAEVVAARQLVADLLDESGCGRCGDDARACSNFVLTPAAKRAVDYLAGTE